MNDFNARLKTAVTADASTPLVFIGNFEVEERWALGEVSLPRLSSDASAAIVNRMDEFSILLGNSSDVVVLKEVPDVGFLADLDRLGFELPRIMAPSAQLPGRSVTEDALADAGIIASLSALKDKRYQIYAHGTSNLEEELALLTGLPMAAPTSELTKLVNSKVYSRRLAHRLGIHQPRGWACTTVEELNAAVDNAEYLLADGPVVIKEAYGVSGKGITVVPTVHRLKRLAKLITRCAEQSGERLSFCVEEWLPKDRDFNYQITVGRDGEVAFDFVKEALTEGGVHRGHRFPARLDPSQRQLIEDTAQSVGSALAQDGFFGVAGIDALTEEDGTLHPLIEINARNNMSTYQLPLQEKLAAEGQVALARHYEIPPSSYTAVRAALAGLTYDTSTRSGVVINNFATVNAAAATRGTGGRQPKVRGRLYTVLLGRDEPHVNDIDAQTAIALERIQEVAV